jgi:hypothetical protein
MEGTAISVKNSSSKPPRAEDASESSDEEQMMLPSTSEANGEFPIK